MFRTPVLLFVLSACTGLSPLSDPETPPQDRFGQRAEGETWAYEDTNGVGTHRVRADGVNVRGDNHATVLFTVSNEQQLVLTGGQRDVDGVAYVEAVFKSGSASGQRGYIASQFLSYSELRVCGGTGVSVRQGDLLENVVDLADAGDRAFIVSSVIRNTGTHRYFEASVNGTRGFIATDYLCAGRDDSPPGLAMRLINLHAQDELTLWTSNFGRNDGASPYENVEDTALGYPAEQSCHGTAPCGAVDLDATLLSAMVDLHDVYDFDYFVTSIAGASHSYGSYHYSGRAIDIGTVNGTVIYGNSNAAQAFMNACWELGAIEVFGPSNDPAGHWDHLHCAW